MDIRALLYTTICLNAVTIVSASSAVTYSDFSFEMNPVKPFYSVTPGSSYTMSCPLDFSSYEGSAQTSNNLFWYFNDQQISRSSPVFSTTAERLHIARISDSEYGNYSCRFLALNGALITSPPMLLVKGSAPALSKKSRTLQVAEQLLFYVECLGDFGSPPGKVSWFKDNEEIVGRGGNLAGSSNPMHRSQFTALPSGLLEVAALSQSNFKPDSNLHCEVTNVHGKDTSGLLAFRFINPDSEEDPYRAENKKGRELFVDEGDTAVLECGPSIYLSDSGSDSFEWNKKHLSGTQLIDWQQNAEKYRRVGMFNLQIMRTDEGDNGRYQCIVKSEGRYIHIDVTLQVIESPVVSAGHQVEIQQVMEHETVQFSCPVMSQPEANIRWLFNSLPVTLGEFFQTDSTESILTVYGSETSDRGIFQCLATNGFGWASTFGHLTVIETRVPELLVAGLGAPETVLATTISSRFIQLAWRPPDEDQSGRSKAPLQRSFSIQGYEIRYYANFNSQRYKVVKTRRGATSANITDLTPNTAYTFRVRAMEKSGGYGALSVPQLFPTLAEVLKPDIIRHLRVSLIGPRKIDLQWDTLEDKYNVRDYEVLYREENTASAFSTTSIVSSNTFSAVGLQEFTRYNFMVRARNEFGFGAHCEPIRAQTLSDLPSGSPTKVKVFADSISRLIVQWKPPVLADWNGHLIGYYVKNRAKRQKESKLEKYNLQDKELLNYISALDTGVLAVDQISEFVLQDLEPDSDYEVSVAAINVNGTGPYSAWIGGRTMVQELPEDEIPGKCELSVESITDTTITLAWKPPPNQNSTKIRGYKVQCNKLFKLPWNLAETVDSREFSITFRDLQPDTTYICALVAYNQSPKMSDANAAQMNVKTSVKQPLELPLVTPTNLKTLPLTEASIGVRFDANSTKGQIFQVRCMPRITQSTNLDLETITVNTSNAYYYFSNLRPSTEYLFDVRAVRGNKASDWGFQVTGTTQEDVPGDAPQDFTVSSSSKDELTAVLTWKPPQYPNGKITGYLISYSQQIDAKQWAMEPVNGPALDLTVPDLKPETIYYFKIQAKTSKGTGPWSYIKTLKTGVVSESGTGRPAGGVGLKPEHVYIIIAAVIGASLIIVCLILAFVVCHVFTRTSSKHRLNPMQYMPTNENSSTMQTLQTYNVSNPPDLWVGHSGGSAHNGSVEVKQIEQDALRKSPHEVNSHHSNGITYYQQTRSPVLNPNGYPSGSGGVTQYQPMTTDPKMSPQGFSSHNVPPPLNMHQGYPTQHTSTNSNFPQLGRGAFMTSAVPSPLPATISVNGTNYPKGYHEIPTIQSPTAINLQMMQQRTGGGLDNRNPQQLPLNPMYSPNSNVSGTSSGGYSNQGRGDRSSTGGLVNQFVRPSASTVVARSKPPSYPQTIPLNNSCSASTTGVGARQSDETSSDRLNSTATEEDVNQATERMMELMSRVNQISNNL